MSKKIAVLVTDHFEDSEYTEPVRAFKKKGHEITAIEMEKGETVKGKQGKSEITIDESIDHVSPENFDALFIPGGFSPDILRADECFVSFAKAFMDAKKTCVSHLLRTPTTNHC
jgi:protease I